MIGSRFSGIAVRKSEIAASGPLVPASGAPSDYRSGKPTGLGTSEPTIFDNGLLCQLQVGFRAELDFGSSRGEGFLRQLAVGRVKSNFFVIEEAVYWVKEKGQADGMKEKEETHSR